MSSTLIGLRKGKNKDRTFRDATIKRETSQNIYLLCSHCDLGLKKLCGVRLKTYLSWLTLQPSWSKEEQEGEIKLGKGKIKNTSSPEMQHEESARATSARATSARATTSTRAVHFQPTTEVMKMMTTGELTNSIIMLLPL